MKKDLHPDNYRPVAFKDTSNGDTFIISSTAPSDETIEIDGEEYPLVKVHVSSASHPYYTGKQHLVDVAGRVDKFKARQKAAEEKRAEIEKRKKSKQEETEDESTESEAKKKGLQDLKEEIKNA